MRAHRGQARGVNEGLDDCAVACVGCEFEVARERCAREVPSALGAVEQTEFAMGASGEWSRLGGVEASPPGMAECLRRRVRCPAQCNVAARSASPMAIRFTRLTRALRGHQL